MSDKDKKMTPFHKVDGNESFSDAVAIGDSFEGISRIKKNLNEASKFSTNTSTSDPVATQRGNGASGLKPNIKSKNGN